MARAATSVLLIILMGLVVLGLVLRESPPVPSWNPHLQGASASTVSGVRMDRSTWLSPEGNRVWILARIGITSPREEAILIDLGNNQALGSATGGIPLGWLGDTVVLFYSEGGRDPLLKKFARKLGGNLSRRRFTCFYRIDLASGESNLIAEVEVGVGMDFCALSPDRKNLVATWGPADCRELTLSPGSEPKRVEEKYVWAPCFLENDRYLFVGETAIQSRKLGGAKSERFSQPLLREIRDAIKLKGTPSIEICGRIGNEALVVDHVPDGNRDRLLKLDERTSLLREITGMRPSRTLPSFSSDGRYMVYQGNAFDRNNDTVFFQDIAEGSEAQVLVEGVSGQMYEADPVCLPGDRVLYIHRGTELRSLAVNEGEESASLHWPESILP
ncbi:MAG: hypothetical protein HUU16_11535 [Candidatus Omnitrophica bacterium]|nr:hypothetical protein [bacterium]NUN96795.1 hypothetical protein [Candidatus Omnitrophota bacterium]